VSPQYDLDLNTAATRAHVLQKVFDMHLSVEETAKKLGVDRRIVPKLRKELDSYKSVDRGLSAASSEKRMISTGVNIRAELSTKIEHARRELDESLVQLAKLPAIDADRLNYAAHALNNYLMVVSTISHVLERDVGVSSNPDAQERLTALNEATRMMKAAVRQLTLPSDDSGLKLILLPVNLTFVAAAACDEYAPIAAKKGIRVERDVMDRAVMIWSDRIALGAVIDNLMSNAVKYSRPGGLVRVRAYLNHEGTFAVSDSGPGIPQQESSRLFSRGGRLSAQPTGGEASSGYGLAIAKDLTDALGGRIWWENDASGATFSVALPLYDPARHTAGR